MNSRIKPAEWPITETLLSFLLSPSVFLVLMVVISIFAAAKHWGNPRDGVLLATKYTALAGLLISAACIAIFTWRYGSIFAFLEFFLDSRIGPYLWLVYMVSLMYVFASAKTPEQIKTRLLALLLCLVAILAMSERVSRPWFWM